MQTLLHLLIIVVSSTNCAKLPSIFQKCDYHGSDLEHCIIEDVMTALSHLQQEPLKTVAMPTIEPLKIKAFSIAAGTGRVGVRQDFENASLYGISKAQITAASLSLEEPNPYLNLSAYIPQIKVLAQYHLDGKVLLLSVYGSGDATIIFSNVTVQVFWPLQKLQKKGLEYLEIGSSATLHLPTVGNLYTNFENLYNGNKELGEVFNKVVNDNSVELFGEVKSSYEQLLSEVAKSLANNLFRKVPLKDLIHN